jgi:hypothetical protein
LTTVYGLAEEITNDALPVAWRNLAHVRSSYRSPEGHQCGVRLSPSSGLGREEPADHARPPRLDRPDIEPPDPAQVDTLP